MKQQLLNTCLLAAAAAVTLSTGAGADDTVCFEAESATNVAAPMQVSQGGKAMLGQDWHPVEGASGNRYVEVPQGKGNPPKVTTGECAWTFEVDTADTYILWCRAWWDDECGNSVSVSLDGASPFSMGQDGTYKRWHWVKSPSRIRQLKLDAGKHTLVIKNREDGVRLDQILLTCDRVVVPVGIEPVTLPQPKAPSR